MPAGRFAADLPDVNLPEKLRRPPWHVATTAEIAEAAGISFGRLGNWTVRKQFVPAEPLGLYRVNGHKRVYRVDGVVEWISGVSPAKQATDYLAPLGLGRPEGVEVWEHVRLLERMALFPHRWRPRDQETYLATLVMK